MSSDCIRIDGSTTLQEFVERYLLMTAQGCFVVTEGEQMIGLITPREVHSIDRSLWPVTPIRQITLPFETLPAVAPDTAIDKAVELMTQDDLNQVPVISGHHFEGLISRGNVLRVLQSRIELQDKPSRAA